MYAEHDIYYNWAQKQKVKWFYIEPDPHKAGSGGWYSTYQVFTVHAVWTDAAVLVMRTVSMQTPEVGQ